MFALVDGNNFFASCERVFRPTLGTRPLLVLSSNDGCVIARSPEVKALGIRMGQPWFEIRSFAERHGVLACSSNPPLYADMSNRMMNILQQFAPRQEVYSIDECFLDLDGMTHLDLDDHARQIRQRVRQWLGLPVCVGIAPTRTLAKLANHCAKLALAGSDGVCDLTQLNAATQTALFSTLPVGEVWGIGRKLRAGLQGMGIHSVADLQAAEPQQMRRHFSITVENIVHELNGHSRLTDADPDAERQQIISSRSFGTAVHALRELEEAVAAHVATAAAKLRRQHGWAAFVQVYIRTSPHDTAPLYQGNLHVPLTEASHDTLRLTRAALWGLRRIYRPGLAYHKAGVALLGLSSTPPQADLFAPQADDPRLMTVLDRINTRFGPGALRSAATAMSARPRWQARRNYPARGFTTCWQELAQVSAR